MTLPRPTNFSHDPAPRDAAAQRTEHLSHLTDLGWSDVLADAYAAYERGLGRDAGRPGACDHDDLQPARISRVDRSGFDLIGGGGRLRATPSGALLAAAAADSSRTACVGDWAVVRDWPDGRTTVEELLPRTAVVVRATAGGQSQGQVLVANLDVAMVVEPLLPEPDLGRIERFLALAWQSGAQPCVVLTKADLVNDAEEIRADVQRVATGASVHAVSSQTGDGLDELASYVERGRTIAMLGPSGAGKSTLTNALAGSEVMATRELRADGKGRHTTAHRELVVLPNGGIVIDTPGLRSVGLFDAQDGIDRVFDDIESLAAACRFNDCAHETEPGCAVQAAIDAGDLDPRRLASWRKLQREMLRMEMRHDARLRQAELAKWKTITKGFRTRETRRSRLG